MLGILKKLLAPWLKILILLCISFSTYAVGVLCTQIGCVNHIEIFATPKSTTPFLDGIYRLTINLDGIEVGCRLAIDLDEVSSTCNNTRDSKFDVSMEVATWGQIKVTLLKVKPENITLEVYVDESLMWSLNNFKPTYIAHYPNGYECDKDNPCWNANPISTWFEVNSKPF